MISEPTLIGITGSIGSRLGVEHQIKSVLSALSWSLFDCIQLKIFISGRRDIPLSEQ